MCQAAEARRGRSVQRQREGREGIVAGAETPESRPHMLPPPPAPLAALRFTPTSARTASLAAASPPHARAVLAFHSLSHSLSHPAKPDMLTQRALKEFARSATRSLSSSLPRPSPANSHTAVALPPTVANSGLLRTARDEALWTPGLRWRDEDRVGVGFAAPQAAAELQESDLRAEDEGGRPTEKMKCVELSLSALSR